MNLQEALQQKKESLQSAIVAARRAEDTLAAEWNKARADVLRSVYSSLEWERFRFVRDQNWIAYQHARGFSEGLEKAMEVLS